MPGHETRLASPAFPAVSLFSNCGAGDLGFAAAGFVFRVLAELEGYRLEVAKANHPDAEAVEGDLRSTLGAVVKKYRRALAERRPALLAACPPCQGMSTAQSGRGRHTNADDGSRDPRNVLVKVIADAAVELEPRAIVVENVPAFLRRLVRHPRTGEPVSAARYLIDELSDAYEVFPLLADLASFGVPQRRRRAFLTFIRRDESGLDILHDQGSVPYPVATHEGRERTVTDALTELRLPALDAASAAAARSDDPLHFVSVLPPDLYAMVRAIPPGTGESAWRNDQCPVCRRKVKDPDAATCPHCDERLARPVTVGNDGALRLVSGFRRSSYRRMRPDEPAATVTTASGRISSDLTLHPTENRVLSPRECEHLQTFPPTFQWADALNKHGVMKVRAMIGEAVPPLFTQLHGQIVRSVLDATAVVSMSTEDSRYLAGLRALDIKPS